MGLICFDLDNTLINSERADVTSYNYALRKYGFKKWKFSDMVKLFGMPHDKLIMKLSGCKDKKIIDKINKTHDVYLKNNAKGIRREKGVIRVLSRLKKEHDIAIVSNASHESIVRKLKIAGISKKYFNIIIGNDDVSNSKPWPDEILKAEKLMNHNADYMVGDSIYDVMAGKRAKVKTIAVLTGRYSRRVLEKYKPNHIIKDMAKIIKIL